MLAAARKRFAGAAGVELVDHNLARPLPELGRFDAVVSLMAIHHLDDQRKRSLFAEVFELLEPGGVFADFEHVTSPLEWEDPSDRLAPVETLLGWLREAGFDDVDCYWKWLETALLIGIRPI
jgi:cyclopropane fatty-acyl-phospholipid synthase-like methyltransferase